MYEMMDRYACEKQGVPYLPKMTEARVAALRAAMLAKFGPSGWPEDDLTPEQVEEFKRKIAPDVPQLIAEAIHSATGIDEMSQRDVDAAIASQYLKALERPAATNVNVEDYLRKSGERWWEVTFKHVQTEQEASACAWEHLESMPQTQNIIAAKALLQHPTTHRQVMAAARWADYAFPVVQLASHRYAAALMATQPSAEARAPWPAFVIRVPNGLLSTESDKGVDEEITHVLVHQFDMWSIDEHGKRSESSFPGWNFWGLTGTIELHREGQRIEQLLDEKNGVHLSDVRPGDAFQIGVSSRDERTLALLTRLVLNTCIAVANQDSVKPLGNHPKGWVRGPTPRKGVPSHVRTFKVGKPIQLDVREALADFVSGTRGSKPKTVRFVVRGHWRNQACGVGMQTRKLMWIEPYWKGPQEAAILQRPHVVGSG